MKRKHKFLLATLSLCVFAASSATSNCDAQNLQTSSAKQTQFYGQWTPPPQAGTNTKTNISDAIDDRFRNLFPPTKLQPIKRSANPAPDDRTARYPLAQQPAPMEETPPRARPLQPITQSNFIQGTFTQDPNSGGDFARVNHHEASTADAVMPLPKSIANSDWLAAPKFDTSVQNQPWIDKAQSAVESSSAGLEGLVGQVQSGGKDLMSRFQTNGGWGEKISSFFGGGDSRFKQVFGSLAVVIGGYLAFVFLMRRFNPAANRGIPSEVIEVVGNAPFGPRKNLQLVRLGSKLLLLMSSPEGTHPVGEITDPEEVNYLISLCNGRSTRANSSVRSAIGQLGRQAPTQPRMPGRTVHPTTPAPPETTFSTSQLVQALESIQNPRRGNTVFEA